MSSKSEKKAKIRMGATRQILQAQPKILKKYQNTKSTNHDKKFSQNSMFRTLKV
jgi:hypothetical protein